MTQDETIELARQVGFVDADLEPSQWLVRKYMTFAELIAKQEREECAKVCDQLESGKYEDGFPAAGMAWECANAIRARGQE